MSLLGALAKLQKRGSELYLQASQFFSENNLIRETWIEMSRDMEQQTASLKGLPGSFWSRSKLDETTLDAALELCSAPQVHKPWENEALRHCFSRTLDFEEPLILRTYVPLIRVLRTEWTDHALDFYIIVKAHVARLTRIVEPFSGDPVLTQRATHLMETFEREVQVPAMAALLHTRAQAKAAAHPKVQPKEKQAHAHQASSSMRPLSGRAKTLAKRPKTLVKKIELPRRRARRG